MMEGTQSRGRPRTKYINQINKDARDTSYRELKDTVNDKGE